MTDPCLACGATETECAELCGCCDQCDHQGADDHHTPDGVALPGLEHDDDQRWSKTSRGYLAHLAQLPYPEPWTFWGLCTPERDLTDHRGDHTEETECVWLVGGGRVCRALIVIEFGAILHEIDYTLTGADQVRRGR